jgi:alpha-glucosidase
MKYPFLFLLALCCSMMQLNAQWALDFNGDEDYVLLNGADFPPPWTMEVKINKNETDNYQHLLTSTDGNSGIRNEQWWGTQVGFTRSGVADYYFNYSLPVGQWVHLAMVNLGTSTQLYVNGNSAGTVSASINFPMKWISKPDAEASMKAKIDELRIWNTNLSQAVIQQYMNQSIDPSHPNYANLQHYYMFEEGTGNICHDSKGTLDGTIYGATWYTETDHDLGIIKLVNPERNPDNYSTFEEITIRLKNYGLLPVTEDFTVSYTLDGGDPVTLTVQASINNIAPNETLDVSFPPVDMNTSGTYEFVFSLAYSLDENPANDNMTEILVSNSHLLGNITDFTVSGDTCKISCGTDKLRIIFYKNDMFRIWLGVNGVFSNPAGNQIVVSYDFPPVPIQWSDAGIFYKIETNELVLRAYKEPLMFALYRKDNQTLVWQEVTPLDYGTRTFQYLIRGDEEYYYGCGMQNGYFSHRGKKIKISKEISNWDDGAVPNPVPFYMSTAGYGAFRNTFTPGEYDFRSPAGLSHDEQRFDCFYFHGPSLKKVLDGYTELTGRPVLPPRWGLELGDADCYNDEGQTTPDVIETIADRYRLEDLPGGWILPNDGYGCGYVKLDSVVQELGYRGFHTGLWTESGLAQLPWEVGTAGVRAYKLDVAWVGSGYQNALSACKQAYEGIENNCDGRGFVWSVCGWAGTQRYSVVWSGDQSGNWEYIRFHIPTIIGAGLSGYNLASSDLDGIFGGSQQTYIRDLQWKTFIPVFYAMSGWATKNRQPWVYGDATTAINRQYLKLKMRLTPYMYTYCNQAYETGVPAVRAMVLEFPDDPVVKDATTRYQFMSGDWFLVAPVYQAGTVRDSIYFPEGKWIDYWDGTIHDGPSFLNGYNAPINKLPVFVKSGAIIPMYPEMLYDGQKPADTLTLDVYPDGYSSFELYEDDGITREHRNGAFSKTLIECQAPEDYGDPGIISLTINPSVGDFEGKLSERAYWCKMHYPYSPFNNVSLDGAYLQEYASLEDLMNADSGYYFDYNNPGPLYIKTPYLPTNQQHVIVIDFQVGMNDTGAPDDIRIYPNPARKMIFIEPGNSEDLTVRISDTNGRVIFDKVFPNPGSNAITVDLSAQPDGTYIVTVERGEKKTVRKIVLL